MSKKNRVCLFFVIVGTVSTFVFYFCFINGIISLDEVDVYEVNK